MAHALPMSCLSSTATVGMGTLAHLSDRAIIGKHAVRGVVSPIDAALANLSLVSRLAVQQASVWHTQHGLILSTAAVGAAEDYFRSILAELVGVCRFCEERVQDLETRMAYVRAGSLVDALRGSLENTSFSNGSTVKKWSKQVAGFEIQNGSTLDLLLREYERACHIRHCAVHSGGHVSTRNARALGLMPGQWIALESPDVIHQVVAVTASVVRSYNQRLFEFTLSRWIDQNELTGVWQEDRVRFDALWTVFRSTSDIESARLNGQHDFRPSAFESHRILAKGVRARARAREAAG